MFLMLWFVALVMFVAVVAMVSLSESCSKSDGGSLALRSLIVKLWGFFVGKALKDRDEESP